MRIDVNGVGIETRIEGAGPTVLLIHGWPDTGHLWRNQVGPLVEAGYQVVVPDLRGCGGSDKPEDVQAYNLVHLLADLLGVLDHAGAERAHVVGHDWGSALAWTLAAFAPDRVESLVAMSVGHPAAFANAGVEQRERSWYMLLFQFPGIAETWLADDDFANLRAFGARPDIEQVVDRLRAPGALSASLGIYRANMAPEILVASPAELPRVTCPTLALWGSDDRHLLEQQMQASAVFVDGPWHYERLEGAGHWLQLDAADQVTRLILEHVKAHEAVPS